MVYNDADGDGWPDDLDADPLDPANPGSAPADFDGDGAPDMFDPYMYNPLYHAGNPRDDDGDGIINFYDTYGTTDVFNVPDNDGDGYPGIPSYDPDDNDPAIPFLGTDDADGDGWPTYLDGGPGDTSGTGDDNNPFLPLTPYSYKDSSPDYGTRGLLFASNRNTPFTSDADPWVSDIFLTDGKNITPLTNDPEIDENPVWLDDGRYIAWLRDGDLVYMPMEECQTTNSIITVASDPGGIENPVWQPNTTNIFYNKGQDVYYAGLDGVEYQLSGTLEDGSTGIIQGEDMTFSPEGEFLWYHKGGQNYYFDMAKSEEHLFNGIGMPLTETGPQRR